jgi:hypothetical protein
MTSLGITVMWAVLFVVVFFGATATCMVAMSHCLRAHCMRDLPPAPGTRRSVASRPRERLEDGNCEAPPMPMRKWMGVIVENPDGEKTLGKV